MYYAVMVSAQVQTSPAQINLRWSSDDLATGYTIYRKAPSEGSWSQVGSVGGTATTWTDSNVSNGSAYEYHVKKSTSWGYYGNGYVYAGINAPLVDTRGKVILLVDNSYSGALASELTRLTWDLAGDGWTVLRHDVSRNDTVRNIKSIVAADYYSDPSHTKAVFLFGHIPVPYSGNFNPDGHPDHVGAWPADVFYGDIDGNWTDNSVNNGGAARPANQNVPGDGKFDQTDIPSTVELAVGRVDFNNMTCYSNKTPSRSELDLLRAYLNKDHNFRHRVFTVERRGVVCDNFGERSGEAFAASGWRNFGAFFGAENVSSTPGWTYFSNVGANGYLWSYGTGGGSYYTCDGVGSSDNFATTDIKSVFTMFLGSYFGDWDNESNFLRAPLGSGYCLTTSWAGRPHWYYHHMGLGETIGYSTLLTQNNTGLYENQVNYAAHQVHEALLGDPTLRMHPVIPPNSLHASVSGSSITLTWNGSGDSAIQGYHVYRGGMPNGGFTRLTSSPISGTTFTDPNYSSANTYMVRAVKLETSGSGTYYNASQGIIYPENGSGTGGGSTGGTTGGTTGGQTPAAPSGLAASSTSASQVSLVWVDNGNNETGYRVERKTGPSGTYAQVATLGAGATSYSDSGLAPSTQYVYRVFAVNGTVSSAPSGELTVTTATANSTQAAATFVKTDTATKGSWQGVYGKDGVNVIPNSPKYPGYAQVSPNLKFDYEWIDTTSDVRALQEPTGALRVAACWFSPTSFTVDINLIDGNSHQVALYFLDWDRTSRNQKVEILDASNNTVLNTQTVSSFGEGIYLVWNVKGAVRFRFTNVSGPNAVLMGLFFDPASNSGGGGSTGGTTIGVMKNGKFQLHVAGQPGQKIDIYASDTLPSSWVNIATVTLTGASYDYEDPNPKPLRFYRVVVAP